MVKRRARKDIKAGRQGKLQRRWARKYTNAGKERYKCRKERHKGTTPKSTKAPKVHNRK